MKKLLIIMLILVLLLIVAGLVSPTDYDIGTSIVINATPAAVHEYVGDLRRWPDWSPWDETDPTIKTTFGETTTGAGASQTWTSDDGDGELTITRSDPEFGIAYEMAFINDGERTPATSTMVYRVVDGGTEVTWSMQGDWAGAMPPVVDGLMRLLTPVMIGGMFDSGLGNLKKVVEADAAG